MPVNWLLVMFYRGLQNEVSCCLGVGRIEIHLEEVVLINRHSYRRLSSFECSEMEEDSVTTCCYYLVPMM